MALRTKSIARQQTADQRLALHSALLAILIGTFTALLVTVIPEPLKLLVIVTGSIALAATLYSLEVGLLLLVFMTYIRLSDVAVHDHGLPSIAQPYVLLLFVLVALKGNSELPGQSRWIKATLLLGSYGLVRFASLLYADDFGRAFAAMTDYVKDTIIAILIVILLRRGSTLRNIVWILLCAGIFLGSFSTLQYLTEAFHRSYWGFSKAELQHIIGETNDYRISGPLGDPNSYAQILLPLVPLAIDRLRREWRLPLRLLAAWALAACILSIVFTFSRGAFVSLVFMLGLLLLYEKHRLRNLAIALALGGLLLALAPAQYTARLTTLLEVLPGVEGGPREEVSFRGRASEAAVAQLMFLEHPLLGVGLHNYPAHYQDYSRLLGLDPRREPREPHSLYLQIASETGLLGLSTFSLVLLVTFRGMWRARKIFDAIGRSDMASMILALGIGIIGYLTAAIFLHAAYPRFFWVLVGIALAAPQAARFEQSRHEKAHGRY